MLLAVGGEELVVYWYINGKKQNSFLTSLPNDSSKRPNFLFYFNYLSSSTNQVDSLKDYLSKTKMELDQVSVLDSTQPEFLIIPF
jgi:hypothetical protein